MISVEKGEVTHHYHAACFSWTKKKKHQIPDLILKPSLAALVKEVIPLRIQPVPAARGCAAQGAPSVRLGQPAALSATPLPDAGQRLRDVSHV